MKRKIKKSGKKVMICRRFFLLFWCLLIMCGLVGCKYTGSKPSSEKKSNMESEQTAVSSNADNSKETFKIVTSFYPLYIMVLNLTDGIEGVKIDNMAEPQTGCLHDYQLRPGDLICLEDADVFVANGGGMEEFLSDVLATYPSLKTIYTLDGVDAQDLLPGEEHEHEALVSEEEQGHEKKKEDTLSAETYESGEINPHTWLDPDLYKKELQYLSAMLGEMDEAHKKLYEQNRIEYTEKIDALMEKYEDFKRKTPKKGCVLLHESFAYLAEAFGFPVLETIDVEKDSGFSAKEIRTLIDEVREAGDGMIISDSQYSGRISMLLSNETGMKTYQLDSCVSGKYEKDAWLNSMEKNLEELKNASN